MRIRFKPWARPELEACKFYIDNPEDYKGKWKTAFKNTNNPIHLELGCGKGNNHWCCTNSTFQGE